MSRVICPKVAEGEFVLVNKILWNINGCFFVLYNKNIGLAPSEGNKTRMRGIMMRERLIKMLLLGVILTFICTAGVFADTKGVNLIINGQKLEGVGVMIDGQVMVPLETLARAMGGTFEWTPENETAAITLPDLSEPAGNALKDGYTIKVNKITEGISILTVSGEVTNTSNLKLTALTVYGKLLDADGQELTRTFNTNLKPTELAPGETGTFEVIFMDYNKFKDSNTRYGIYVLGLTE